MFSWNSDAKPAVPLQTQSVRNCLKSPCSLEVKACANYIVTMLLQYGLVFKHATRKLRPACLSLLNTEWEELGKSLLYSWLYYGLAIVCFESSDSLVMIPRVLDMNTVDLTMVVDDTGRRSYSVSRGLAKKLPALLFFESDAPSSDGRLNSMVSLLAPMVAQHEVLTRTVSYANLVNAIPVFAVEPVPLKDAQKASQTRQLEMRFPHLTPQFAPINPDGMRNRFTVDDDDANELPVRASELPDSDVSLLVVQEGYRISSHPCYRVQAPPNFVAHTDIFTQQIAAVFGISRELWLERPSSSRFTNSHISVSANARIRMWGTLLQHVMSMLFSHVYSYTDALQQTSDALSRSHLAHTWSNRLDKDTLDQFRKCVKSFLRNAARARKRAAKTRARNTSGGAKIVSRAQGHARQTVANRKRLSGGLRQKLRDSQATNVNPVLAPPDISMKFSVELAFLTHTASDCESPVADSTKLESSNFNSSLNPSKSRKGVLVEDESAVNRIGSKQQPASSVLTPLASMVQMVTLANDLAKQAQVLPEGDNKCMTLDAHASVMKTVLRLSTMT
jgi:hypothetical protein